MTTILKERAAVREAALRLRLNRKAAQIRTGQLDPHNWRSIRRDDQVPPAGDWFVWLILAGRGFGKTRTGSEETREFALRYPGARIALVGETFADVRDTMVEGVTGLLSVCRPSELRGASREKAWNRSLAELYFANGSQVKGYSSERPDQLRGPAHHYLWGDEPAKWKDASKGTSEDTTWTNAKFGLRELALPGWDAQYTPRAVLTGTPKPVALLRSRNTAAPGLLQDALVAVTRGKTEANLANLAPAYIRNVIDPLIGTRLGRQELDAELLEDVPGALWTWADIEQARIRELDLLTLPMERVVIAVDPSGGDSPENDEVGIVACGKGYADDDGRKHGYLIADRSGRYTPREWARAACQLYDETKADRIVAETNYGGQMVIATIAAHAREVRREYPTRAVTASRGKAVRAEPISTRYEQGIMHHAGTFPALEEEITSWIPGSGMRSPNRLDALVWAMSELFVNERGMKAF